MHIYEHVVEVFDIAILYIVLLIELIGTCVLVFTIIKALMGLLRKRDRVRLDLAEGIAVQPAVMRDIDPACCICNGFETLPILTAGSFPLRQGFLLGIPAIELRGSVSGQVHGISAVPIGKTALKTGGVGKIVIKLCGPAACCIKGDTLKPGIGKGKGQQFLRSRVILHSGEDQAAFRSGIKIGVFAGGQGQAAKGLQI